jgi:rhodanese-related sulfurtransferase
MNYISPKDWIEKFAKNTDYQLIDIRESYECVDSKIDCLRIPMDELATHPEKLNSNTNTVLICNSGQRAEALANLLETDYQKSPIFVIEGGYFSLVEML